MTEKALPIGKLAPALLAELLEAAGQTLPAEILVGPRIGEDAAVIAVKEGILVAATDPITMTGHGVGAHAVVINANDVAVTGVRPQYFLASVLFPEGTRERDVRELFREMGQALARIDAVLVGGHTEITHAVRQTIVTGQMLGTAARGDYVTTGGLRDGDRVLQIGLAPVEGAAVFAAEAGERVSGVEQALLERARHALEDPGISVVDSALRATELGARALHDPTEGGLSAGLFELADASGLALLVDADAVLWYEPGVALCRALGADPWGTLASGALLAGFDAESAPGALDALERAGWRAALIGRAQSGSGVRLSDGRPLPRYSGDEASRVL